MLKGSSLRVAGLTALAVLAGCAGVLRYPEQVMPPRWDRDADLLGKMNASLLSGLLVDEVAVEIDWVAGCRPARATLDLLGEALATFLPPSTTWEVLLDDEIPREGWDSVRAAGEVNPLATVYLDHFPDLRARKDVLYLVFAPRSLFGGGVYGQAHGWVVPRAGRIVWIDGASFYREAFDETATSRIAAGEIERVTVIHELGHMLGLVHNPAHTQRGNPGHCAVPDCVMTYRSWRSWLHPGGAGGLGGGLPDEYCDECLADIAWARGRWAERTALDDTYPERLLAEQLASRAVRAGQWLWIRGRVALAAQAIETALRVAPEDPDLHEFLGDIRRRARDFDAAEESYTRSLALRDGLGARSGLAVLYCVRGRYDKALEILDPATLQTPTDLETVRAASWALVGLGRPGQAAALWDRHVELVELGRGTQLLSQHRARLHRLAGHLDTASRIAAAGFEHWPWDRVLLEQSARIDLARGREDAARARLRAMIESLDGARRRDRALQEDWRESSRIVYLALAGDREAAMKALAAIERLALEGQVGAVAALRTAGALALLDETSSALDVLEDVPGRPLPFSYEWDVCLHEDLVSVRTTPRFHELFPHCLR